MIPYKNSHGTQSYPFIDKVPFPQGLIKDIKVVLKNGDKQPYISKISCGKGSLQIVLNTISGCLGTFIYQGSPWITLDNDAVFGFVQLVVQPTEDFSYTGIWRLYRGCYTFGSQLHGIQRASANGLSLASSRILNVQLAGDITIRQTTEPFKVNIGRDLQPHQQYTSQLRTSQPYITQVNGLSTTQLIINSSNSSIEVQAPIQVQNSDIYVMYINTLQNFPRCSQWENDGFSEV